MIYDCFSFFNELDLLEIRLNTLDKVVDKFILAAENKDRFAKFSDRIVHIVVNDFPAMPEDMPVREKAWTRENWQRNAIVRGLPKDIGDNDILLISDMDEIPDPAYVEKAAANPAGVTRFDLRAYCFFINLRNISYPIWNNGTRVLTWRTFNDPKTYAGAGYTECCVAAVNQGPSATRVRFLKPTKIMKPAGWHFSYLGGVEAIQRKMKSIAHTEFDTEKRTSLSSIEKMLANGRGFVNSAERFLPSRFANLTTSVQNGKNPSKPLRVAIRSRAIARDFIMFAIGELTPRFLVPLRHKIFCRLNGMSS